ncbi:nitroreductase family protein [Jatrophihabitans endophyticus]|uniref:nitroreductase family protein n=1 Tax=Jatrophihabitans endophyticus TaxID=1206085 RepID=UPI0019DDF3EB|nr:nitroreductase family protein [Jatrophihabitans endophyticus]
MEFQDAVRTRRMIRDYDPDRGVERSTLEMLLNLANRAPSAGHTQGWRFLVLDDITSRSRFWSAASTGPADAWRTRLQRAPVLVVFFSDRDAYLRRYAQPDKAGRADDAAADRDPSRWPVPFWDVDTGMAALLLLLAAHDHGLAASFFGVPGSRWPALAEVFRVPSGLRPVGVVSVGHPAAGTPAARHRGRRPLQDVLAYGSFA